MIPWYRAKKHNKEINYFDIGLSGKDNPKNRLAFVGKKRPISTIPNGLHVSASIYYRKAFCWTLGSFGHF